MNTPLAYSTNEHCSRVAAAYDQTLNGEIELADVQQLGYPQRTDFFRHQIIDAVESFSKYTIGNREAQASLHAGKFVPACLLYRHLEDMNAAPYGGEFLPRRFDDDGGMATARYFGEAAQKTQIWEDIRLQAIRTGSHVAHHLPGFTASANISASLIERPDFSEQITENMGTLPPEQLHLELIEFIPGLSKYYAEQLRRVTDLGIGLSIDDCPDRYAPKLFADAQAFRLPISTLKMDSAVTTDPKRTDEIKSWYDKAAKAGVSSMVFEGKYDAVITPRVLDRLNDIRNQVKPVMPWLIEGPVYEESVTQLENPLHA